MFKKLIFIIKLIILLFLLFILGLVGYKYFKGDDVYLEVGSIIFKGEITPVKVEQFKSIYSSASEKPNVIKITSQGGSVSAGIELGFFIVSKNLNVIVSDYCFSSCANYVFTAGVNKIIEEGSFVGWHGSAIQANFLDGSWKEDYQCEKQGSCEDEIFALEQILSNDLKRQAELFSMIGLDEAITVYGQDIGCDCSWTLSIKDMERFGVSDVTYKGVKYFTNLSWDAERLVDNTKTRLLNVNE